MYKPRATKQFRKDLRRYTDDFERLLKTTGVLHRLLAGEALPPEYRPHKRKGEYKDTWEWATSKVICSSYGYPIRRPRR